jgi:hypothetical protein
MYSSSEQLLQKFFEKRLLFLKSIRMNRSKQYRSNSFLKSSLALRYFKIIVQPCRHTNININSKYILKHGLRRGQSERNVSGNYRISVVKNELFKS